MACLRYMTGAALLAASIAAAKPTANITKTDVSASNVLPFGALINQCVVPGTVALTFDDGPFSYTSDLLEILAAYGAPSTFFLNGHCLGDVYYNSDIVQRIVAEGHQLGSHTCVSFYLVYKAVMLCLLTSSSFLAGATSLSLRSTTTPSWDK